MEVFYLDDLNKVRISKLLTEQNICSRTKAEKWVELKWIKSNGKIIEKKTIKNKEVTPYMQELELKLEMIEKGGYEHFMLKEIHEQPKSIFDSIRGRIDVINGEVKLGGLEEYKNRILNAKRNYRFLY